jgi:hypothetical protein
MDAVLSILTAALCVLAFVTWRVYKLQAWLSGALESHSLLQLRMLAADRGIPTVWWDPSMGDPPSAARRVHGQVDSLETVYLYVPTGLRADRKNLNRWKRFRRWLNAEI